MTAKRKPLLARPDLARVIAPLATGIAVLLAWQVGCRLSNVPVYLVPAPTDIARTLFAEAPSLLLALLMTLKVTVLAFAASIFFGVLFAVLMVQNRVIEASLLPYAILLQVTPVVAVAPLIIVWVRDTTLALVLCAMMVAIFPIISNTILGLRSVPPSLRDLFQIYRANRWQTLVRLRIPAALPFFFGGLRISSGLSLIGAVVAEFVAGTGGANAGLAYQILLAGMQLNIPLMFAALVLIAVFGVLQFLLMVWLTRLVMRRWHDVDAI